MNDRKLVAVLACRNNGSRLYAKPLQNLDYNDGVRIIDNIITCLKMQPTISEIILAVSDKKENLVFNEVADIHNLKAIKGNDTDVLARLILAGRYTCATDIFRVTSESPFVNFKYIANAWQQHLELDNDATFLDGVIDGTGFEILTLKSLEKSHLQGGQRHKSELCSLFIRENSSSFKILKLDFDNSLSRPDLRLTVDYPEDLIVCRKIYDAFKKVAPCIDINQIVSFLDENPDLKNLVSEFTEQGYSNMYI